jgi:tetratricopeptide (TPR) repeat protein
LSGIALALAAGGDEDAALEIIELVLSAPPAEALVYVPDALAEIALALTDVGCAKDAAALGERTLELAERRWHDFIWERHIASLGQVFAMAGETERALSVVEMLDDVGDMVEALTEAARGLTRKNEAQRALRLAEHAYEVAAEGGTEFHVGLAEREIACALAALGNIEDALDLVRELDNPFRQSETLEAVTEFVLPAGDVTALRDAVDAIGDAYQRDSTLRKVAVALGRGDYRDEALEAAQRLSGGDRIMVVSAVARSLARAGRIDEASPLVERMRAAARRQLSGDSLFDAGVTELGELARALVDVGKQAAAVALADKLLARGGDNESTRAAVAPLFSYAGDYERAADVVASISPAYVVRDDALREIAPGLVRDGQLARLLQLLGDGAALPRAVAEIVSALVAVNELEACRKVWHACLDQARTGDAGEVYSAFSAGAPFIAALDGGRTLVAACEAALTVDAWWRR